MVKKRKKTTELEHIAYHEAGHAVMAYLLRRRFHSITIDPDKLDEGVGGLVRLISSKNRTNIANVRSYSREVEKHIRITLAGEVARGIFIGQEKWDMSQTDIGTSFELAQNQCGKTEEANAYINWLLLSVRNELKHPQNWACVCAVAKALLEHKTLSYRKARKIINAACDEYNSNPSPEPSFLEEFEEEEYDGEADIYL